MKTGEAHEAKFSWTDFNFNLKFSCMKTVTMLKFITLLLVRHSHGAAVDFLNTIQSSEALRLEWVGPERFHG